MDRSGNRRFLPVQVDARKADCHILDDPEASRAYFAQLWAEIMAQYDSGAYTTYLSKAGGSHAPAGAGGLCPGGHPGRTGSTTAYGPVSGDKLCTMQIFKEGLDHLFDEPKAYETREIREIVDAGIRRGEIKGWRRYENNRRFAKYGRQRGWERMIPEKAPEPQQLAFVVVDEPDLPWKDETEGQQAVAGALTLLAAGSSPDAARVSGLFDPLDNREMIKEKRQKREHRNKRVKTPLPRCHVATASVDALPQRKRDRCMYRRKLPRSSRKADSHPWRDGLSRRRL